MPKRLPRLRATAALAAICREKSPGAKERFRRSLDVEPARPAVRDALRQLDTGGTSVR